MRPLAVAALAAVLGAATLAGAGMPTSGVAHASSLSRIWTEGGGTTSLYSVGGWGAITATWVEPVFPPYGSVFVWPGIQSDSGCPSSGCLVQAGAGGDMGTMNGSAVAGFFMEDYPRLMSAKPSPPNPVPGDLVSVSLSRLAPGQWRVTTADLSQHTSVTYTETWRSGGGEEAVFAVEAVTGMPGRPLCTPVDWRTATATTRSGRVVNALAEITATQVATAAGGAGAANGCNRPPPPPQEFPLGATTATSMAATLDGGGYWITTANGGVFAFGDAPFYGSMGSARLTSPIAHITATPDGKGYWLVAADGGVFAFGDAPFYGSMGGYPLNAPVVDLALTPHGHGYWLVASDGGVFAFGSAQFYGSMGGTRLNASVVGIVATPGGHGYRMVAADGGIFDFGSAAFYGSAGSLHLNAPVVGMAATPNGQGYWLVGSDGGIFAFGDAVFHGSTTTAAMDGSAAGMAADPTTGGYWLVRAIGGLVFAFDAPLFGSA